MRTRLIGFILGFTSCGFMVNATHASMATTPKSQMDCPVYTPCGPGMEGYYAGVDENGCNKMACRPEGTGNDGNGADDDTPPYDYPTGDGLDDEQPQQPPEHRKEYKHEKNGADKNVIPPRLIDVR